MKEIKHKQVKVQSYGYINSDDCPCKDMYAHYLWMAAPEIKWLHVEDVGSHQGTVFAIGKYKGQWFIMKDYYGSCSSCGAWGEGGEPENLESVLKNGELFTTKKKALNFVLKTYLSESSYERPTDKFIEVLNSQGTKTEGDLKGMKKILCDNCKREYPSTCSVCQAEDGEHMLWCEYRTGDRTKICPNCKRDREED